MNLIKGHTYDTSALRLIGWTEGDGTGHEGYHLDYYFSDGAYLGADEHGIEPIVESDTVWCHGCGDEIQASEAHQHNGENYCDGCEATPAEPLEPPEATDAMFATAVRRKNFIRY